MAPAVADPSGRPAVRHHIRALVAAATFESDGLAACGVVLPEWIGKSQSGTDALINQDFLRLR